MTGLRAAKSQISPRLNFNCNQKEVALVIVAIRDSSGKCIKSQIIQLMLAGPPTA